MQQLALFSLPKLEPTDEETKDNGTQLKSSVIGQGQSAPSDGEREDMPVLAHETIKGPRFAPNSTSVKEVAETITQLAGRVLSVCLKCLAEVSGDKRDIERIMTNVSGIKDVINHAHEANETKATVPYLGFLLQDLEDLILECRAPLEELLTQALNWPRIEDVTSVLEGLNRHKAKITLVLDAVQK